MLIELLKFIHIVKMITDLISFLVVILYEISKVDLIIIGSHIKSALKAAGIGRESSVK